MREGIEKIAAQFPPVFGLRAFPGERFTINVDQSFFHGRDEREVALYVFTEKGAAFCKGSPDELQDQIVK